MKSLRQSHIKTVLNSRNTFAITPFPQEDYQLLERTDSYSDNIDDFSENTKRPDYKLRCLETGKEFFVEVKYRTFNLFNGKLQWCEHYQLKRYLYFDKNEAPVFICLGIDGTPDNPERIILFPLSKIKYQALFPKILEKYEFYRQKPVFSSYLWNLKNK